MVFQAESRVLTSKDDHLEIREEGGYCRLETPVVEPGRETEERTVGVVNQRARPSKDTHLSGWWAAWSPQTILGCVHQPRPLHDLVQ